MITVQDNYFDEKTFGQIQEYCKQDFEIITVGEKQFSALPTPESILPFFQIDGHHLILTFIRSAHKDFDNDLRVHADNIINGHKTNLACVFYINDESVSKNGTAFYKHHRYGRKLPEDISNKEFDRIINEDANDSTKWVVQDTIIGVPNRLLVYDSNYFHSKFPSVIEKGVRKVLVAFYKKIK